LTHCLLLALEEMNYQGTYYELWWRAVRILREMRIPGQHFQLTFSDGADPTLREAFEPVGAAEARAFARRAQIEQQASSEVGDLSHRSHNCFAFSGYSEIQGSGLEPPLSARGATTCSCSGPGGGDCVVA